MPTTVSTRLRRFLVLNAEVVLSGARGVRTVALKDFYRGPYETVLEPGEILAQVRIPPMSGGGRAVYVRYGSLAANDWPCLGVAALLSLRDRRVVEMRLALGGLAATPLLVRGLDAFQGQPLSDDCLDGVVAAVERQISPVSDLRGSARYKRAMAGVFVKRALREVQGDLPG